MLRRNRPVAHCFPATRLLSGVVAAIFVTCGCGHSTDEDRSPVIATVGSARITQDLFDHFAQVRSGVAAERLDAGLRASLLMDLKQLEAAALEGAARQDPATREEVELRRLEVLAHAAGQAGGVYARPSDQDVRDAYAAFVKGIPAQEYRAAHILVATENTANSVIVKLQGHADFAALARAASADDSSVRGGELGWIAPGKLPAPFISALQSLSPGQFTTKPIHTSYGWHVIRLLEARAASPPPFEQVRAQLEANIVRDRERAFLARSLQLQLAR
jgi:peptidyl-prolyl cis-trans isomerase C